MVKKLYEQGQNTGWSLTRASGRVNTKVLDALGKVHDLKARRGLKLGEVEKELMGDATLGVGVAKFVVALEPLSDIVGREDRSLGRVGDAVTSEHPERGEGKG